MKERISFYRPAMAAFLVMMAMALTTSTISFFLEPVCESLQISRGSFSLVFSLMGVSGALVNPFLGQYAGKKGVRGILLLAGLWTGGCMFLMSMVTKLWMLYVVSFCMGLFGSTCVALCGNIIVQQHYAGPSASGILGTVMAGSGVGGMLFNLLIPGVMAAFGWRMGLQAMGVSWLTLLWMGMLLLRKQTIMQTRKASDGAGLGMTRAEALKSPKLYLQMMIIIVITACGGLLQQLPPLLSAKGFSAAEVSVMISAMTAFLAFGKFAQGLLYGKIGVKKGGYLMMTVFAVGCLAMLHKALAWPGLLMLAMGMGIYTTLLPMVARQVFGSREYASIWGLISTVGCVGTFVANPIWGTIYDLTGTYTLGLISAAIMMVCAMWAHWKTLQDIG